MWTSSAMGYEKAFALASLALLCLADLLASLDPQLAGIPQRDGTLKFTVPDSIHAEVGHPSCDAQWDVDNVIVAIITKDRIQSQPPVKEVTRTSVTIDSCSSSVRYFIDCFETQYRRDIIYTCMTSTQSPTSQPPESVKEATGSSQFQETTPGRKRDALIIAVCLFIVVCLSAYLLGTYWNSTRR